MTPKKIRTAKYDEFTGQEDYDAIGRGKEDEDEENPDDSEKKKDDPNAPDKNKDGAKDGKDKGIDKGTNGGETISSRPVDYQWIQTQWDIALELQATKDFCRMLNLMVRSELLSKTHVLFVTLCLIKPRLWTDTIGGLLEMIDSPLAGALEPREKIDFILALPPIQNQLKLIRKEVETAKKRLRQAGKVADSPVGIAQPKNLISKAGNLARKFIPKKH